MGEVTLTPTPTQSPTPSPTSVPHGLVDFLLIGGGGAGGYSYNFGSGGGGGGGYIYQTSQTLYIGIYDVVIGGGGNSTDPEQNGGNTTFSGLTATGGGAGKTPNESGNNGGCGGGAGAGYAYYTFGGTGSQGYNGGNGSNLSKVSGGGGGGIGSAGEISQGTYSNTSGGDGGSGLSFSLFGSSDYYAGGGGGGGLLNNGIGGNGYLNYGGGGMGRYGSGAGGSGQPGVVKLRFLTSEFPGFYYSDGVSVSYLSGYTYVIITQSAQIEFSNIWPTPSVTPTQTQTPTITPSITPTNTITPTVSGTPQSTPTPTRSLTRTVTPTKTQTPTSTVTQTPTQTQTPSVSPTRSLIPSVTPSNEFFNNCYFDLEHIKKLYIGNLQTSGTPINYPIVYEIVRMSRNSIVETDDWDPVNLTILIGGQRIQLYEVYNTGENIKLIENQIIDNTGKRYEKILSIELSGANLSLLDTIKDASLTLNKKYTECPTIAFLIDENDVQLVIGYDKPLFITNMESVIGLDNKVNLVYESTSISRIRFYKELFCQLEEGFFEYSDLPCGSMGTFVNNGWIMYFNPVLAAQSTNGKIIVAGTFWEYSGVSYENIIRLNLDGSIDTTFQSTGFACPSISDIHYHGVFSIDVQTDDKILCGGKFETYNGTTVRDVCRINKDGTLDTTFLFDYLSPYFLNLINYVKQDTDGGIIVGGESWGALKTDQYGNYLFNYSFDDWANVYTSDRQPDGKLLLGGIFYPTASRFHIRRYNVDNTVDTGFTENLTSQIFIVRKLAVQSDGKIVVGGTTEVTGGGGIERLNSDGSQDLTFTPYYGQAIYDFVLETNGKITIGNIRLNDNGTIDNTYTNYSFLPTNVEHDLYNQIWMIGGGGTNPNIVRINNTGVNALCPSRTPTPSVTASRTPSRTRTPSVTPSTTPSVTPTSSITPTTTPSLSISSSVTPTQSVTPTMTKTPTPSQLPVTIQYRYNATESGGGSQHLFSSSLDCNYANGQTISIADRSWITGTSGLVSLTTFNTVVRMTGDRCIIKESPGDSSIYYLKSYRWLVTVDGTPVYDNTVNVNDNITTSSNICDSLTWTGTVNPGSTVIGYWTDVITGP